MVELPTNSEATMGACESSKSTFGSFAQKRMYVAADNHRIAAAGETVEQYNAKTAQGTMLKRPGRAEEVAAAILFWPPTMPPTSPAPCCSWTAV